MEDIPRGKNMGYCLSVHGLSVVNTKWKMRRGKVYESGGSK